MQLSGLGSFDQILAIYHFKVDNIFSIGLFFNLLGGLLAVYRQKLDSHRSPDV
jgi:hypothetical protein